MPAVSPGKDITRSKGSLGMNIARNWFGPLFITSLSALPAPAALAEDALDFYAKLHMSTDYSSDGETKETSLSDNSSRFGFQGNHQATPDIDFYWRMEQKVYVDESGGRFGNPAYAGLATHYGRIQAGFMDTPYKLLVSPFNIMDDTVADVRGILGYSALGEDATRNLNVRARNAIMAQTRLNHLELSALYSFDYLGEETASGQDNNNYDGYSLSLVYKEEKLMLGLANERWMDNEGLNGIRLGARYDFGSFNSGLILETIGARQNPAYRRQAAALDVQYPLSTKNTAKFQIGYAGDYDGTSDSGATQFSIGGYHSASDDLTFYLIYSRINNDINAHYRLGTSGHGDIISPAYGDDPWALSLGLSYRLDYRFK